ncbi:MAG TPA: NTP transferase domain-containing protein [Dehalococcoidia bacterium]|nr:NTP transferase domain-containing protein [Dehalococcoidia bacterium]
MQAVILAAGDGGRLRPQTDGKPKALLPVAGRPMLAHVLDALRAAGVDVATVVGGYEATQIVYALPRITPQGMRATCIENADWRAGNARSLWAAREHVPGDFVLVMGDHLVDPQIIRALVGAPDGRCRLAIDRAAAGDPRAGEATRARLREGRVVALGKALDPWDALDTGAFWCTLAIFEAITPDLRDGELSAVFAALAEAGELDAVDVTGRRWIDIDTQADLHAAEAMFGAGAGAA